jgi:hypothetical protein
VLLFFRVWSVLQLGRSVWWIWEFLAWTDLTGKLHRPDRCRGLLCEVLRFFHVPLAGTGLTGAAHRFDRCSPVVLELLVLLRSRVGVGCCWYLGPVALQWLRGLGQLG